MVQLRWNDWVSTRRFAARLALTGVAMLALAGCISSETPIFDDSQKPFGDAARFQFYSLRDGTASDPNIMQLLWNGARYTVTGADVDKDNAVSFHRLDGGDLVAQAIDGRPGRPVEYAVLRQLADGVYLVNPVDEDDADDATRTKFCVSPAVCRVTTREQVIALAHATAAKRHMRGGLAIRIADDH